MKTTVSFYKPASSKNNSNRPALRKNDVNSKVDRFGSNNIKHAKKSEKSKKLSKSRKSDSEKLAKSKKLLKSENSSNFDTKKAELTFLTFDAKTDFNCLQLIFTKTLIL